MRVQRGNHYTMTPSRWGHMVRFISPSLFLIEGLVHFSDLWHYFLISERGVIHTMFVHRTMVSEGIFVWVECQIMALTQTNRETYTDSSLFIKDLSSEN